MDEKKRVKRDDDNPPDPDDPDPEDPKPENPRVSEQRIEVGMNDGFPRLRPQLEWGGTDELLDRDAGEYKRAENYAELMSINPNGWYNGAGNRLYLANEKTDQMRYGRTFYLNYKPSPLTQLKLIASTFYSNENEIFTVEGAYRLSYIETDLGSDNFEFHRKLALEEQELYKQICSKHKDMTEDDIIECVKQRLIKENLS